MNRDTLKQNPRTHYLALELDRLDIQKKKLSCSHLIRKWLSLLRTI